MQRVRQQLAAGAASEPKDRGRAGSWTELQPRDLVSKRLVWSRTADLKFLTAEILGCWHHLYSCSEHLFFSYMYPWVPAQTLPGMIIYTIVFWNFFKFSLLSSLSTDSTVKLPSSIRLWIHVSPAGHGVHAGHACPWAPWITFLPRKSCTAGGLRVNSEEQSAVSICTQQSASLGREGKSCTHSPSARCQLWVIYINLC